METVYAVAAVRVSSTKQGLIGDSQADQREKIQVTIDQLSKRINKKIIVKEWFEFTESASKDIELQPIGRAIDFCKARENRIKFFFVKSIDRFTRGGPVIYSLLKSQLSLYGVDLIDTYGVISQETVNTLEHLGIEYSWSKYQPSSVNELLEAENSNKEIRTILTRMVGAEIRYRRMGYHIRQANFGFSNIKVETPHGVRVVLTPKSTESDWVIRMFEERAASRLSDEEIVSLVNSLGYKSRPTKVHSKEDSKIIIGRREGTPLTVKRLQQYIKNPIYAGIIVDKWTNYLPIKAQFPGLVSINLFNRANRGKVTIVEDEDEVKIIHGSEKKKRFKDNPIFPYKRFVLCPVCGKEFLGSSPKGKGHKPHPTYHCARQHKYFGVNAKTFNKVINDFLEKVDFTTEFRNKFKSIFLEEWEKRKETISRDSITAEERVLQLKQEAENIAQKIKVLDSPVAIKMMEDELERIELEKAKAISNRDNKEQDEVDVQEAINRVVYFMEHPAELLLGSSNPTRNAAMFGLLFDDKPTYQDLVSGTPKLCPLFRLKEAFSTSESSFVTPAGVEPAISWMKTKCPRPLDDGA